MSDRRGSRLAERMKARLDEEEAARAKAVAEQERRLADGRAAREELFADLEAFATSVGRIATARQGENLVLRRGDHFLECSPMGDGDRVKLTYTGSEDEEHRLYREAALDHRWVWSFTRRRRQEGRLPLFDAGLEELLVLALGMPRVTPEEVDPIVARPRASRRPVMDPFAAFASTDFDADDPDESPPSPRGPVKRNL